MALERNLAKRGGLVAWGAAGPCGDFSRSKATVWQPGETPRYMAGTIFNSHAGFPLLRHHQHCIQFSFPKLLNRSYLFSAGEGKEKQKNGKNRH